MCDETEVPGVLMAATEELEGDEPTGLEKAKQVGSPGIFVFAVPGSCKVAMLELFNEVGQVMGAQLCRNNLDVPKISVR